MKEFAFHILDIAENSIRAGATRIEIKLDLEGITDFLRMEIADNGCGMEKELLERVSDPFFTSKTVRKIGLGIPLLRQHAEMTGGKLEIFSKKGKGTRIIASFNVGHPDMQPAGDIEGCWYLLASRDESINVLLKCTTEKGSFQISTQEVLDALGADGFSGRENRKLLLSLIRNNLEEQDFYWE